MPVPPALILRASGIGVKNHVVEGLVMLVLAIGASVALLGVLAFAIDSCSK